MKEANQKYDEMLLVEIQDGNDSAIDEMILKYRYLVETIATKYINSPLEKDDLIQEGMIGLLAAIKSYSSDKGAKFITYASRCINNSVQTAISKFSRIKDIPQANIIELDEDALSGQAMLSAEDIFLANESVSMLIDTLYEELSKFENEVLRLHIVGCSYNEIADKLGKNPKAIDNAMQRIRKKLSGVAF